MIDTEVERSPGWWVKMLAGKLHDRRAGQLSYNRRRWSRAAVESSKVRPGLDLLDDYFRGDPPLRKDIHEGWAEPFRQFVRMGRLNLADLLVSATGNRMGIRDFKTAAAGDEFGDAEARRIMEANELDLVSSDVHDYMLALGDGYLMVTPPDSTREIPLMTAESPLTTITAHDAATGEPLAGLKMFRDEWLEQDWAYLFLPAKNNGTDEGLHVARMEGKSSLGANSWFRFSSQRWDWVPDMRDTVPGGHMPIIRFKNKRGVGEFEHHLDHLDRINDKIFNEWWIGKINGFRQRAVKNLPDEDTAGNIVDYTGMFVSSPDALWQLPEDAEIWESAVVVRGPVGELHPEGHSVACGRDVQTVADPRAGCGEPVR